MTREEQRARTHLQLSGQKPVHEADLQPELDEFPKFPPRWNIRSAPILLNTGPCPTSNLQDGGATRGIQRGPYGSGDMDDGYTLVFENLEAFQTWRVKEEEEKVIEFVKGDTHGRAATVQRSHQIGLCTPFYEREEKVREEISREGTKSAQSQGLAHAFFSLLFTNPFALSWRA